MMFIGGVVALNRRSCLYFLQGWIILCFLNFLFSFLLCCVYLLSTFCLSFLCLSICDKRRQKYMKFEKFFNCFYLGEMKLFLKGGENKVFFLIIFLFDICCYCIFVICYLYVFISAHAVMCSFEYFKKDKYILIKIFCLLL